MNGESRFGTRPASRDALLPQMSGEHLSARKVQEHVQILNPMLALVSSTRGLSNTV